MHKRLSKRQYLVYAYIKTTKEEKQNKKPVKRSSIKKQYIKFITSALYDSIFEISQCGILQAFL